MRHREYGVGEVLERNGRERVVRFASGVHIVVGRYVPLDEGSLEVRAFQDPAGFLAWIDEEPTAAAVALLRSNADGLDAQQAVRKLTRLGVPDDVATRWWTQTAEPLLRARDDVRVSDEPFEKFTLRHAPDPDTLAAEAAETLVALSKRRVGPEQRTKLTQAFEGADRTVSLPPALRGAARALGVSLAGAPPLGEVNPAELPADVVRRLLEHDEPRFLARVVVDARGPDVARAAAERCRELVGLVDRASHAATVCEQVAHEVTAAGSDTIGAVAERLSHRVQRLRLLVPDGATPALAAAILQLTATIDHIPSDDKQLTALRAAAQAVVGGGSAAVDTFAAALRLDSVTAVPDEVLARTWANEPLTPTSTRLAWLRALARHRRDVLTSAAAWRGVDVAGLQTLAGADETRAWLFGSAAGQSRLDVIARSVLSRLDRASLGELTAGDSDVLAALPPGALRESLEKLAEREPSLRAVGNAFAAGAVEEAEASHLAEIEEIEARHADMLRAADDRIATAEASAGRHAADAELARRLMRSAASEGPGAAELRQARIDGLRVAADILAEANRAKVRVPEIAELAGRLQAIAEAAGLRRDADPGAVVPFDHLRHRPVVDEELSDGVAVTVVEPAWLVNENEGVTAIRYGLVRRTAGSKEGEEGDGGGPNGAGG